MKVSQARQPDEQASGDNSTPAIYGRFLPRVPPIHNVCEGLWAGEKTY